MTPRLRAVHPLQGHEPSCPDAPEPGQALRRLSIAAPRAFDAATEPVKASSRRTGAICKQKMCGTAASNSLARAASAGHNKARDNRTRQRKAEVSMQIQTLKGLVATALLLAAALLPFDSLSEAQAQTSALRRSSDNGTAAAPSMRGQAGRMLLDKSQQQQTQGLDKRQQIEAGHRRERARELAQPCTQPGCPTHPEYRDVYGKPKKR
ncbi:MAG: hypothetical protein C0457_02630 [Polymorphum sp.]|nr:hypothetical protein [Polymorphum sp.]